MSGGFFADEQIKNAAADEPWKKSETDRMLDLYFFGSAPKEIAVKLKRNPKAVQRRLEQFIYNERDRAVRYEPRQRVSRQGQRWTPNETLLRQQHVQRKVPLEATARVLARAVSELTIKETRKPAVRSLKVAAPTLDLIWALRYAFYVYKDIGPLVSDDDYDDLVQEEIDFGGGSAAIKQLRNTEPRQCPSRIKSLALYLVERFKDEGRLK